MEKLNICFTSIGMNVYSETFIQNIKNLIEGNVYYCYGGFFPTESEDGKLKNDRTAPLLLKGLNRAKIVKRPLGEIYFKSYLKKNNINLIIANYGPSGVELYKIANELKIPLIVHFHGFDASQTKYLKNLELEYRKMFAIAFAIVVVSEEMKNTILSLGANPGKVILLRYAPSKIFHEIVPNYESNQVLAIGRFTEKKAPYLTLLAIKKAQEKCPELKFKIVGTGELFSVCKDLSIGLGMNNVVFSGILTPEQIKFEMSNSFCFIQHSKTASNGDKEGTPVAILEAMSAGLPIISTFHAGIPDVIINNVNGFLSEEGDVDSMSENIIELFKNRVLAKKIGIKNQKFIKNNLSFDQYAINWNKLIRSTVNEH